MLRLIKISFSLNLREIRNIALMVCLPILLTLILGVALSSVFNETSGDMIEQSKWLYKIDTTDSGSRLREFLNFYQPHLNMTLEVQLDEAQALEAVSNLDADAYLIFENDTITIYKNEHSSGSTRWLEIVFENYLNRAAILTNILDTSRDRELVDFIYENYLSVGTHVELYQVESAKQPNAIGYYAVAMITLTACYTMIALILGFSEEKRKNTLKRYLISGKSFFSFLLSKSISVSLLYIVQMLVVMTFVTLVYRVDFGSIVSFLSVLAASVVFAFALTQFATMLCLLFKNLMAINILLNAGVLPVMLFFGGAYLHFHRLISIGLENAIVFSPVYHINKGLFDAIYLDSYNYIIQFAVITAVISALIAGVNAGLAKWRGNSWVQ